MHNRLPWWSGALALMAAIALTTVADGKPWPIPPDFHDAHWRPDQCEAPRFDHAVVEFQNTWSNLAYLAVGLLILYRRPGLLGAMAGVNLCIVSLFSGWYHASLQPLAQAYDVGWIYAVILSMCAYGVRRRVSRSATVALAILPAAIGLTVSFLKANGAWRADSTKLTLGLLAVLAVIVGRTLLDFDPKPRALFACAIAMPALLSAVFRFGDGRGHFLCDPTAALQAHALWHLFGALALAMTYNVLALAGDPCEAILPAHSAHPPTE